MPHSAFSDLFRRLLPSRWLLLLPGGLVLLSGCFQAQALYRSVNSTGRPSIEDLEAASFPLPPSPYSQGTGTAASSGIPPHPGWQQQYGMPPHPGMSPQPGMQPATGLPQEALWPTQPRWPQQIPTTDASPVSTRGQNLSAADVPGSSRAGDTDTARSSSDTAEPVGNRVASWLRNAAYGPSKVEAAAVDQAAAAAPAAVTEEVAASQGKVRLQAAPAGAASAPVSPAPVSPAAVSRPAFQLQNAAYSAPAVRPTAERAHEETSPSTAQPGRLNPAAAQTSTGPSPAAAAAAASARTPQPVAVRPEAPVRLVRAASPAAAEKLEPAPDPSVPSSPLLQTAATRPQHTAQSVLPAQYQQPAPAITDGPASPVRALPVRALPVRSASAGSVSARSATPPVPGPQQAKAIRVAALLKALVQEDQQPGGGELARRQRLMGASENHNTAVDSRNISTSTAAQSAPADQNTLAAETPGVPRITATPVAVSLSAIMDAPGDGLPAAIPQTGTMTQLAADSRNHATAPTSPATDRTRLAEQVRRLSEQLQLLAGPGSAPQLAASAGLSATAPSQVQQVSWQSAAPAGNPISHEATVALLMLRIEQISAQLHQLQSAPPAMKQATVAGGGWQYHNPQYQNQTATAQPAPAPAAISPAELQMLAAVLNRATAATAEREQMVSSPAAAVGPAVYQPAAFQQTTVDHAPADLTQLAGRVAELARQLESASQP